MVTQKVWPSLESDVKAAHQLCADKGLRITEQRRVIARAEHVVVLADHSKLGQMDASLVCDLSDVDYLITDKAFESPAFDNAGVEIIVA